MYVSKFIPVEIVETGLCGIIDVVDGGFIFKGIQISFENGWVFAEWPGSVPYLDSLSGQVAGSYVMFENSEARKRFLDRVGKHISAQILHIQQEPGWTEKWAKALDVLEDA